MRLSDGQRYSFLLRTMSELQARQNTAMQEASTGLRIGKPSDDAPAAASPLRLEGTIQKIKSYQTVISRTSSDAQLAEGIIAESHTLFQRARELTVQASNESLSASDGIAIDGEIAALRDFNSRSKNGHIQIGAQGLRFQRIRKRETGLHHGIEHSLQMWVDHRRLLVIQLLAKPEKSF